MIVDQTAAGAHKEVSQEPQRTKVVYTSLGEAEVDVEEPISIYGVIIDAGYPYKGQSRYICSLKVIDETLCSREEGNVKWGLVTFYAKRMEDLPVVRKIGDIIRVHRALVKDKKGFKQFSVSLAHNSSWCLFHSSDI